MSNKQTCTRAEKSFGSRLSRQNIAAIQTEIPFAARTPAVTVTMPKGALHAA